MTFFLFPSLSITFSYLLVASVPTCIYTVLLSIERVFKLVLFVQYRLLSLPRMHVASLWKEPLCDSWLYRYSLLTSKRLQDHVLYLARFQVASWLVLIFTCFKSHDISCDLLQLSKSITWRLTWSIPTPDTNAWLSSLEHQHDYCIRTTS